MENWTIEETKRLFKLAEEMQSKGKGLARAFEICAKETGRKPNSIRNYYYSQSKTLALLPEYSQKLGIVPVGGNKAPFVMFSDTEVSGLIQHVLQRQAEGESVRAITTAMAEGDKSKMLRLQNKYRSVIFNRQSYVAGIMRRMKEQGLTFYNPYTKRTVREGKEETPDTASQVETVNNLLKKFFDARNEQDKLQSLSDYVAELGKILSQSKIM